MLRHVRGLDDELEKVMKAVRVLGGAAVAEEVASIARLARWTAKRRLDLLCQMGLLAGDEKLTRFKSGPRPRLYRLASKKRRGAA